MARAVTKTLGSTATLVSESQCDRLPSLSIKSTSSILNYSLASLLAATMESMHKRAARCGGRLFNRLDEFQQIFSNLNAFKVLKASFFASSHRLCFHSIPSTHTNTLFLLAAWWKGSRPHDYASTSRWWSVGSRSLQGWCPAYGRHPHHLCRFLTAYHLARDMLEEQQ